MDRASAETYLSTTEGQQYLTELGNAAPTASADTIYARALDQLASGTSQPSMQLINSPLIKIVPQGQSVTPYSPYFTTAEGLQQATTSGYSLADYFGLPIKSQAPIYDIYQIAPIDSANVFATNVAPTSELGGLVTTPGGALQYVVPNRNLFSSPTLLGQIGN